MASISVITINFNGARELERTCRSIIDQVMPLEWIVIDGASTDGSQDIISRYIRPGDRFVSEPDGGISDAFNKGLALASGDAVLFMNAGDEFSCSSSLERLYSAWNKTDFRWVVGGAEIVSLEGRRLFERVFSHTPRDVFSLVRTNCQIVHQTVLAESSLYKELGGYDVQWKIAMDYDLWIRWISRGFIPQLVPVTVCRFYRGGASGDPMRNHREWQAIRRHHGIPNGWVLESLLTFLAGIKKFTRGRYGRFLYRYKERLGIRW
jgi:glycosyltransferase involved in cell wall biosynthesis